MFKFRKLKLAVLVSALMTGAVAMAQHPEIALWPGVAPGSEGKTGQEIVKTNAQGEHIVSVFFTHRLQRICRRRARRRPRRSW